MRVHRHLESLPTFCKAVVTLGTFDGVHLGHRQIIAQLKDEAARCGGESVIITFDPHPRKVLGSGDIRLLTTLEEKIALIGELGVDHLVIVPFTPAFSQMSAADYVGDFLVRRFRPHVVILGYDHHFGHNREGNIHLLRSLEATYAFQVVEIPGQVVSDLTVSSTKIRQYLREGQVRLARELLGYPYFVSGSVMHGEARGRTLGFPTANVSFDAGEKLIPAEGVYAAQAELPPAEGGGPSGVFGAAVNIGRLPTFGGRELRIEAYLLDFEGDIYDRPIKISFLEYLRGDRKFDDLSELVACMRHDVASARKILSALG